MLPITHIRNTNTYRIFTQTYPYVYHTKLNFPCSLPNGSCPLPDEYPGRHVFPRMLMGAIARDKNNLVVLSVPKMVLDQLSRIFSEPNFKNPKELDVEIAIQNSGGLSRHYISKVKGKYPLSTTDQELIDSFDENLELKERCKCPTPEEMRDIVGPSLLFI